MGDLKSCPFCGGEASVSQYQTESLWSHDQVTYTQVGCDECGYHIATEPGYEMEAPERWNTRTTPAPAGELEEVPEGWRVYTVDASIEGRWRVMLKGPECDHPAEDDWPAFRGPAYVCEVGHDLASGIAACVAAIANTHPGATTKGGAGDAQA